eukprot:CAMPEP_0118724008 /NCGR_PEP_ID=MMETSP0800-20121206/32315_1 /TAXON_ID=210618 ORGANISM="Striatella unipunctata, Strain CCMP2910" /NCGR_SAMPLE_ID=MMETSP0800 /ASSEMBLY_ACC=CAM_ASM_000638 /LENGTH=979 /DNA_ID=CAMNT_0006632487 /DNA_START=233 /DNA_END=3172 /DNA_ORIENTATION=-
MSSTSTTGGEEELEWPMDKVRSTFIGFFVEQHGHTFWKSSPCVPHDDPTLLFANAGMNQYKPLFLGTADPSLELSKLKRAVNSQKCIRAGGKHNDLDDVGKDVYHHTFFEMLGNWSFGDYFKKEAIRMAWTCLTVEFKLDPKRLYATYFGGDEQTPSDEEARELWLEYLPAAQILPFDAKDNFWEMGATGPCGPCTEIHYDRIGNRDASEFVNADLPDVIEIWNNVFIQYNREADGSLRPLPAQHIDTGMGFERLTSILQNKQSNYDTDIFVPIFEAIRTLIPNAKPYAGKVGAEEDVGLVDMAYRVVADHIRTLTFAIADGAMPSNDGRGYVLRRILRRAVRYGRQNLGAELGFFSKLVPTVVKLMGGTFPELVTQEPHVTAVISEEEESFSKTLDKGLQKFNELAETNAKDGVFKGEDAQFLYATMGFPVDLTELMAEEKGLKLDREGFERKMQEEKDKSAMAHLAKMSAGGAGKDMRMVAEQTAALVSTWKVGKTDDSAKYTWDVSLEDCKVMALFLGRNETPDKVGFVDSVTVESGLVGIILDKTSFYAESGGQVNDTGSIVNSEGAEVIKIENVQSYGQFILHIGTVVGPIAVGDSLTCKVDYARRKPIASNHTMTHVLNYALRKVLIRDNDEFKGAAVQPTVDQKGSLVDDSKLRFDFSWNGPVTPEQLAKVEATVQEQINAGLLVEDSTEALTLAKSISSLRAVFGETYPDPVRVVSISDVPLKDILSNPDKVDWFNYSIELCGGTHLSNTKEAQNFVLLNEEGIAKGIRRITGVTMNGAAEALQNAAEFQTMIDAASKLKGLELEAEVKKLTPLLNSLKASAVKKIEFRDALAAFGKQVVAWKKEREAEQSKEIVAKLLEMAATEESDKIVCRFDFGLQGKVAKSITGAFGKKIKDKALFLVSASIPDDKYMAIAFSPSGMKHVDCKAWAISATEGTGGKGGGKKDSAQFTIPGVASIDAVVAKAKEYSFS